MADKGHSVSREDLKRPIDVIPEEALPFIRNTRAPWTRRSAAGARLFGGLTEGYGLGLSGKRPCQKSGGTCIAVEFVDTNIFVDAHNRC